MAASWSSVSKTVITVPERCLLNFDKDGSEWVICAYFSGDARMIDVIEKGKSPHVVTGALISGASEELILKEHKVIETMTDPFRIEEIRREHVPEIFKGDFRFLPRIFSIRQMGKKCNHALNFMMEEREFSYQTEMDERDCKKIVRLYRYEAYPNLPLWWNAVIRELKDNDRTLTNPFGRKRRFLGEWGRQLHKEAIAHLAQSTNVDMVNEGMEKSYYDSKVVAIMDLLAQVHDSLLWQAIIKDWKRVAEAAIRVRRHMEPLISYGGREFRVQTEMKIGRTWGNMKEVKLHNDVDKLAKDMRQAWESLTNVKQKAA
jgi:hypothetical protein